APLVLEPREEGRAREGVLRIDGDAARRGGDRPAPQAGPARQEGRLHLEGAGVQEPGEGVPGSLQERAVEPAARRLAGDDAEGGGGVDTRPRDPARLRERLAAVS